MSEARETKPRRVIPLNVALSTLSLLMLGGSLMFYDVRIGLAVIGGLAWLDLFVASVLEQLGEMRASGQQRVRGVKRHDRSR